MHRLRDPYLVNIALGLGVVLAFFACFVGLSVLMYLIGEAVVN